MKKPFCKPVACILVLFLFTAALCPGVMAEPIAASSQKALTEPSPADTFIDALFYRPVGLALIPIGTALFIVSLPFSVTGGNVPTAFNNLVTAPAKYTFCRPLGEI